MARDDVHSRTQKARDDKCAAECKDTWRYLFNLHLYAMCMLSSPARCCALYASLLYTVNEKMPLI